MENINFRATLIEASAGTGKTQRLTQEYLKILDKKNPAESIKRILAITFSEKAAIEMKERILKEIFEKIYPNLSEKEKIDLENQLFRLRISTIHSFCQQILRRFSLYLKIDPFFKIIEDTESNLYFFQAIGKFLNLLEKNQSSLDIIKKIKLKTLIDLLINFSNTHPHIFTGNPEDNTPLTEEILQIYQKIEEIHKEIKESISGVDFNDLEKLTYLLLSENPYALIVLEDFDEKINFILVDEFQDTNVLQWEIISKLIEEWLSGYGAKAEKGESYGIFIVGDRKQSIYNFRGAESRIFDDAKKKLKDYIKEEKLLVNYRSSPLIIDFVNKVFEDIYPWKDQKLEFPAGKDIVDSKIEINILPKDSEKEKEYEWISKKIYQMVNEKYQVFEKDGSKRDINFGDIAILIRRRNKNLKLLEDVLTDYKIPYIIVGGIGFYQEDEILFLLSLLFSLSDPTDKLSEWNLKNSIFKIEPSKIELWRKSIPYNNISTLLDKILKEINFWENLSSQQKANVEKFLILVESQKHLPLFRICQNFRKLLHKTDEPKADIFSERENAVRILTVHGAKGLEFPAVFLINIEDGKVLPKNKIIYRKTSDRFPYYSFIIRNEAEQKHKIEFKENLEEEEERILYVALTRASQYLFISGIENKPSIWIRRMERLKDKFPAEEYKGEIEKRDLKYEEKEEKFPLPSFETISSYSEEVLPAFSSYTNQAIGQIIHTVIKEISTRKILFEKEKILERIKFYLEKENIRYSKIEKKIEKVIKNLFLPSIKEIISPSENSYVELPFIVKINGKIYRGFIDRIIQKGKSAFIYDYKTGFEKEEYRKQMEIYEKAVREILEVEDVQKFLVFLHEGKIVKLE